MCGILCIAHSDSGSFPLGPDAQNEHRICIQGHRESPNLKSTISISFVASELRLRGESFITQPHLKVGNILCWNGEIFDGIPISLDENDGVVLMDALSELDDPDVIPKWLGNIEGPASQRLYFARDPLGRRSLLVHMPTPTAPYLLLTSVSAGASPAYALEELDTDYIYCLDIQNLTFDTVDTNFTALTCLPRSPDGLKERIPFATLRKINRDLPPADYPRPSLDDIPKFLAESVDGLIYHLNRSVELQVKNILAVDKSGTQPRVAVLFSGGIDSAAIAYFAHKHVPPLEPIDLLNVAFENPRKIRAHIQNSNGTSQEEVSYRAPDRITGLQEWEELRRVCPGRQWNFVEINVPFTESQAAGSHIESIMFPSRTVMDLSLALALYFASRAVGQGRDTPSSEPQPYTSLARVLLNGLGADELMGGYGRHRTAYEIGRWAKVIDELQLDLSRIPTRNLGRDDRIISCHGKETRHPFLSLSVIEYLAALPVHYKMDPRLALGLGDKMLLRLAMKKVGLEEASGRKKRAMQFGSHSARMEGEKRGDALLE
ncbi:hypothetical protein M378DRAFT_183249 [Amanita muscaria Koide BX008]|uniref:Asparagine synthetase domain-containing protein n=1 Tax=Amanita muscaria (strain Koide BX008) TaxID=946122 RepID=A0A0C2T423_AMAMK|nr:hypothetical protein M378DRAFT_183249 [Amanita muscaria Koide BX008]